MRVCVSIEELDSYFVYLSAAQRLLIAVEGASTSGKTHLAKALTQAQSACFLSTDRYYNTGVLGERYQDELRLEEIRTDVAALRCGHQRVVVEGICLRDTLELIDVRPDVYVYCKRISPAGIWHQDPEADGLLDPESGSIQALIDWWSHEYHLRSEPHLVADVVFEWNENEIFRSLDPG